MSNLSVHRKWWGVPASIFTVISTALVLVLPLAGVALAAPPTGGFLNPDFEDTDGPGNVIGDGPDGTDGLYHFVLRVDAEDSGQTISSVQIQTEDGDAGGDFENIGSATQVGSTDTWEFKWDRSAYTPQSDVDNDPGFVRAVVADSGGETAFVPDAAGVDVHFQDSFPNPPDMVEITSPANGGTLRFFQDRASVQGTSSPDIDDPEEVDLFVTDDDVTDDTDWEACGEVTTFTENPDGTNEWAGLCDLNATGIGAPGDVTAVAARADFNDSDALNIAEDSGDAHRVAQVVVQTLTTFEVTPATDSQTVGFCNTFSAEARDQNNQPIVGLNVDVHAEYSGAPATGGQPSEANGDALQFAINDDEEGTESDPFTSPDVGGHTYEAAAGCDTDSEPDAVPDDNDSDNTSDGSPAAGEAGAQGEHDVGADFDTKHVEGETQANGDFRFSLDAEATGSITITAWAETTAENDVFASATESSDTATKTFQTGAAETLDAEPESATNVVGDDHDVEATVLDQNGNPASGETAHFRVFSGPDADEDLDNNPGTPLGYFGNCTTDPDGTCTETLNGESGPEGGAQDDEDGTDQVQVWFGSAATAPPAPEAASGNPDGTADTDRQDVVTKTFVTGEEVQCLDVEPNTDTNAVTASHTITAFVTDQPMTTADEDGVNDCPGNPVANAPVDFSIDDDSPDASLDPDTDNDEDFERVISNAQGQASVTLDNDTDTAGDNSVEVTVPGSSITGYSLSSVPFNFEDIAATGTLAGTVSGCDDCTQDVTMPFALDFFGVSDSTLEISSKGFLNFNTASNASGCCSGQPFPSTSSPNGGLIGGYWEDLDPGDAGDIFFQTLGTAPNRRFIVQFDNVEHFSDSTKFVTFQFKLFEGTDLIEVHYGGAQSDNCCGNESAGVENQAGTLGTQFFFEDGKQLSNEAVRYTPGGPASEIVSKDWVVPGEVTDIDCEPQDDTNLVGQQHSITVTATDGLGDPVSGANVDAAVDAGPHADNDLDGDPGTPTGYFDEANTNAQGQATLSYTGSESGLDEIDCWLDAQAGDTDNDSLDGGEPIDEVRKVWTTSAQVAGGDVEIDMFAEGAGTDDTPVGTENTKKCNANLLNFADVTSPDGWEPSETGTPNTVELVCVSAKDSTGQILFGTTVNLSSSGVGGITDNDGPPPSAASQSAVIDEDGYAVFYISSTVSGTQTLTASVSGISATDTGTKDWEAPPPGEARIIDCEPEDDTNAPGTDHEVVCTVTDGFGNRIPGVSVSWAKTDSGGANSAFVFQQTTTDANGEARATVNSSTQGATAVTGSISAAATECEEAANQPDAEDQGKPAGACSDSVNKTWSTAGPPPPPPPPPPPGPGVGQGYWFVASDGGVFSFGSAQFFGSTGAITLNSPIVGMDSFPTGEGYWMFARDGGVFAFGKSQFFGSTGSLKLNRPVVGGAATPSGGGYYEVASDGGIFSFGDAKFFGSTGSLTLNSPIVAMSVTPTGKGYHLYARDGGVFAFGDAAFHGSTGSLKLNSPITGADNTLAGGGYWEVAADGGIFSFGNAQFFGSTGSLVLNSPIAGMSGTPSDQGYWFVGGDGGIFAFGNAQFHGSTGSLKLNRPIVGMEGRFS